MNGLNVCEKNSVPRKSKLPSSLGGLFSESVPVVPIEVPLNPPEALPALPAPEELPDDSEAIPEPLPVGFSLSGPGLTDWEITQLRVSEFLGSRVSITPLGANGEPLPERVDLAMVVDGKNPEHKEILRRLDGVRLVWDHNNRLFCRMQIIAPENAWENVARERAQLVCNVLIVSHVCVIIQAFDRDWSKQVEFEFYLSPTAAARFMNYDDFENLRKK